MNARPFKRIRVMCAIIATLCFFQIDNAGAEFRAAIAVRDVTPDPLLPVSGGVGPTHPATRKFGRLTVRALTLENDGTRVSICSTDFLGFPAFRIRPARLPPISNISTAYATVWPRRSTRR